MQKTSERIKVGVTSSAIVPETVLRPLVEKYVEEALELIRPRTKKKIRVDQIKFDARLTSTFGFATFNCKGGRYCYCITISKKLFREDSHILRETVLHEVAHVLDYQLYRKWGHGKSWQRIMVWMGLEPREFTEEWEYEALGFGRKG